jgi:tetratricopeptide (TPR) repeat protein
VRVPDKKNRSDDGADDASLRAPRVSNIVSAEQVSGVVVQAGTITGGIHYHTGMRHAPEPRQLPMPPAGFVGRADELVGLTATLNAATNVGGTVVISALAGTGGIGKTWLALSWAHQNLDRFPDGQLFVDLQGFSPAGPPLDPAAAIRGFLDAFGVDLTRIAPDLQAQIARYRELAAGRRMLIVLDNAATSDQVAPLLPASPSCTVLVTSRRHLTGLTSGHGARHLAVDVLSDTDARTLLTTRLGTDRVARDPAAAEELLAFCDGFPLALSLLAGIASARPFLSLALLVAELHDLGLAAFDNSDPTASLSAVLSWSTTALAPEQARVFGLLGIAPGPDIGLPAAANLTGLPTARARAVLRSLEQMSLLGQDAAGRYRMHDLVRQYAAHHVPEKDTEAALLRVVDFYLHTTYAARECLDPHWYGIPDLTPDPPVPGCTPLPIPDIATALAWLAVEHPCLLGVVHSAVVIRKSPRIVWQMITNLMVFHSRRGLSQEQLAAAETGLAAADRIADPAVRAAAQRVIGAAADEVGRVTEAIEHYQQSLELSERAHDRQQQAQGHLRLGFAWERLGDPQRAIEHATRGLHLCREQNRPVGVAIMLTLLGKCRAQLGNADQGREQCQEALVLHRRHDNPDGEAETLRALAFIHHHSGQYVEAIDHYRQALNLFRAVGDGSSEAYTLEDIGHPHLALGQRDEARTAWRKARELYQQNGRDRDAVRMRQQLDNLDKPDG